MNTAPARVGDIVSINGTVSYVNPRNGELTLSFPTRSDVWADPADATIVRRKFVAGDTVNFGDVDTPAGVIVALSNDSAWVLWPAGNYTTELVCDLVLVPPKADSGGAIE